MNVALKISKLQMEVWNVWKLSLKKAEMAVCFFIFLIDSAPNLKLRVKILKIKNVITETINIGWKTAPIIFSCNSRVLNFIRHWSGQNLWEKYYSNLTRILFSRLWLIRLSHRVKNPLEKLILAVLNGPKLNLFDCLIIGPITVDVIHLNHSLKIRFRDGTPI